MIGAEVARHGARVNRFVEIGFGKADRERLDRSGCSNDLLRTRFVVDAEAGRWVRMSCGSASAYRREGNGVKKPSLRLAWIALLMLVVTVCVSIFAVIVNGRGVMTPAVLAM